VVQIFDCLVDGNVEFGDANECLMSQMMRLEVVPNDLDVVQFGGILRQPFDGQPVSASSEGGAGKFATKSLLRLVGLVCTISSCVT
jgi:hypothetical protein